MSDGKMIVAVTIILSMTYIVRMMLKAFLGSREKARGSPDAPQITEERMARLEQAVDAIAFEVERISEGQRFTTRLLSEQSRLSSLGREQIRVNTPH